MQISAHRGGKEAQQRLQPGDEAAGDLLQGTALQNAERGLSRKNRRVSTAESLLLFLKDNWLISAQPGGLCQP